MYLDSALLTATPSIYSLTYVYVLREIILYLVRRMTHQPSKTREPSSTIVKVTERVSFGCTDIIHKFHPQGSAIVAENGGYLAQTRNEGEMGEIFYFEPKIIRFEDSARKSEETPCLTIILQSPRDWTSQWFELVFYLNFI